MTFYPYKVIKRIENNLRTIRRILYITNRIINKLIIINVRVILHSLFTITTPPILQFWLPKK
jgi:hypothetical protein